MYHNLKSKADRLRHIRKILHLSRAMFCEETNLKNVTVKSWENNLYGGLTEAGAKKVVNAAKSLGLLVSERWLMTGEGPAPQILQYQAYYTEADIETINAEIQLLTNSMSNFIYIQAPDNYLTPLIHKGDFIGGQQVESILSLHNQPVIISTDTSDHHIGLCEVLNNECLVCPKSNNPDHCVKKFDLSDIQQAAIITWIRCSIHSAST